MDQPTAMQREESQAPLPDRTPEQEALIERLREEAPGKNMNEIRVLAESIAALAQSSTPGDFALRVHGLACELHDRVVNVVNQYRYGKLKCHHRHTAGREGCNSPGL